MSEELHVKNTKNVFSAKPCPICSRKSVEQFHPFCSKRCADVDLQRWFSGHYAVPTDEPAISHLPDEV